MTTPKGETGAPWVRTGDPTTDDAGRMCRSGDTKRGRGEVPASTEENKRLVRRFYQEVDEGNLDAMDDLVAEDSGTIRRRTPPDSAYGLSLGSGTHSVRTIHGFDSVP